ncbi:hypothetical protein ACP70R_038280 [Stipagrostis hirtigluma subsp. patula]
MASNTPSRRGCRCEEEIREAAAVAHDAEFAVRHSPASRMFRTAMEVLQAASRTEQGFEMAMDAFGAGKEALQAAAALGGNMPPGGGNGGRTGDLGKEPIVSLPNDRPETKVMTGEEGGPLAAGRTYTCGSGVRIGCLGKETIVRVPTNRPAKDLMTGESADPGRIGDVLRKPRVTFKEELPDNDLVLREGSTGPTMIGGSGELGVKKLKMTVDASEWDWMDDPAEAAFLQSRVLDFEECSNDEHGDTGSEAKYQHEHWYYMLESEWHRDYKELTLPEKKAAIARFPMEWELHDEGHWYNRTREMAWSKLGGKECAVCGFQGHIARYCPSPRKWRLEMEGKFDKKTRDESFTIPYRRGATALAEKFHDVRDAPPAWLQKMKQDAKDGLFKSLTDDEKKDILQRVPAYDDLYDQNHWYNKALNFAWTPEYGEQCETCGFQGHDPEHCPSPLRWRKEFEEEDKKQQSKS